MEDGASMLLLQPMSAPPAAVDDARAERAPPEDPREAEEPAKPLALACVIDRVARVRVRFVRV